MDTPKTFFEAWISPVTSLTENLTPPKMIEQSVEFYGNWFASTSAVAQNTLKNIAENSQTLPTQMLLVWEPIYKVIYSNTLGLDTIQKLLRTKKYKRILEETIQSVFPAKISQIIKEKNILNLPDFQHFIFENTNFSLKNFTKKIQSWLFFQKNEKNQNPTKQLQQLIYQTGVDAISKATTQLIEIAKTRPQLVTFEEFCRIWLQITEQDFKLLFDNPNFLQVLQDLIKE